MFIIQVTLRVATCNKLTGTDYLKVFHLSSSKAVQRDVSWMLFLLYSIMHFKQKKQKLIFMRLFYSFWISIFLIVKLNNRWIGLSISIFQFDNSLEKILLYGSKDVFLKSKKISHIYFCLKMLHWITKNSVQILYIVN